jgi:hypothetical protein
MDSRPLLDAFVKAVTDLGAHPLSGHATETRVAVRALLPTSYEPVVTSALASRTESNLANARIC